MITYSSFHLESLTFPVFAVRSIFPLILTTLAVVITSFSVILHFTVPVIRATGTRAFAITALVIAVTTFIVAVTTLIITLFTTIVVPLIPVIPTRGIFTTTATWGRRTATTRRGAITAAIAARVKAPRRRWRCPRPLIMYKTRFSRTWELQRNTYLYLEQVVAADTLVMHFMVRVIRITSTLVFHEGKARSH